MRLWNTLKWFRKRSKRFNRTRTILESAAMSDVQNLLNDRGANNPEVGDYWVEMYDPVCLVIAVSDNYVRILEHLKFPRPGKWTWDIDRSRILTRGEFAVLHRYESRPGYSCDVDKGCLSMIDWLKESRPELLVPPTSPVLV